MQNIIEIEEKNNRLRFIKEYKPIVCGNTNYYIKFTFSEDWEKCVSKTAFFVIEGKKIPVMFTENICNVPAMPNINSIILFLVASSNDNQILSSTPIKLNLERNPAMDKLKKTEPFKSYYTALLGAINKVESGEIRVADVEFAKRAGIADFSTSQVSKTNNEDINGIKNFLDGIEVCGENVALQGEISNPNLLINADFKINQRGKTIYSDIGTYTVDRWKLLSGSVEVKEEGILLNGTIMQPFEKMIKGQFAVSADQSNGLVSATYEDGKFKLSAENVIIRWAKLEVGTIATKFSPKTYAAELLDCQRYYIEIKKSGYDSNYFKFGIGQPTDDKTASILINLPCIMRIAPKFKYSGGFKLQQPLVSAASINSMSIISIAGKNLGLIVKTNSTLTGNIVELDSNNRTDACLVFDAEIY